MLRLKGEPDDAMTERNERQIEAAHAHESLRDHPAFESGSLPDSDDFEDDLDDDSGRDGRWSLLSDTRGWAIAAAAFVPTFVLVFFGVPYLLGEPSLARTPGKSSTVASARDSQTGSGWSLSRSLSEALRGGPLDRPLAIPAPSPTPPTPPPAAGKPSASSVPPATPPAPPASAPAPAAPPVASIPKAPAPSPAAEVPPAKNPAPAMPSRGADEKATAGRETRSGEPSGEPMPGTSTGPASRSSSGSDSATPSLPPAPSRVPEPERKATASKSGTETRSTHPSRQAAAAPDSSRSQAETRKSSGDWTPAAAFADRDAAARLASSIERQGYPVEIRQEASSTRPWVVWIGSQPNGGSRRR